MWLATCRRTAPFVWQGPRLFDLDLIDSRARRAVASATLSMFAACGDSTAPASGSAFYRLATVNSSSLPYLCPPSNSTSYSCALYGGELLLRPDASHHR